MTIGVGLGCAFCVKETDSTSLAWVRNAGDASILVGKNVAIHIVSHSVEFVAHNVCNVDVCEAFESKREGIHGARVRCGGLLRNKTWKLFLAPSIDCLFTVILR